ncbi:hypothetical protein ACQY0O_004474 [Thecaphora frezii]
MTNGGGRHFAGLEQELRYEKHRAQQTQEAARDLQREYDKLKAQYERLLATNSRSGSAQESRETEYLAAGSADPALDRTFLPNSHKPAPFWQRLGWDSDVAHHRVSSSWDRATRAEKALGQDHRSAPAVKQGDHDENNLVRRGDPIRTYRVGEHSNRVAVPAGDQYREAASLGKLSIVQGEPVRSQGLGRTRLGSHHRHQHHHHHHHRLKLPAHPSEEARSRLDGTPPRTKQDFVSTLAGMSNHDGAFHYGGAI